MKKINIILLAMAISIPHSKASFPETFGASFSTRMIGHMSNGDENDPSNNYYAPALLAFSNHVNLLLESTSTSTFFKPINNVVVTNSANSSNGTTYGNVDTSYKKFTGGSIHGALPIGYPEHGTIGTLGFSIYLPIGSIIDTNSGHPFLPEYVMYRSRYQRISLYFNFAHKLNDELAFSLGTLVGLQASADVNTDLSLNGSNYGSWASAKAKVDPSLGGIISVVKKSQNTSTYFAFQQEMKSNLDAHATGEISNPSLSLLDTTISSLLFYDPYTFKVGTEYKFNDHDFYAGLEYQLWSNYHPPIIHIKKNGGVIVPSSDYESIQTQNTLNPRLGYRYHLTDRIILGLGLALKKTPLKGDFSSSGNSIDTDATIISTGLSYRIVVWSKNVTIGSTLEYHQLQSQTVTKSPGVENGSNGTKLGGPQYEIGGHLVSLGLGVKFNF